MKVIVVSHDGDLYKLCREILSDLPSRDWHLSMATPSNCLTAGDLYIWDGESSIDLAQKLEPNLSRHLFLIHRNDAAKLHHNLRDVKVNVLLKPVTRATLSSFLGLAASTN